MAKNNSLYSEQHGHQPHYDTSQPVIAKPAFPTTLIVGASKSNHASVIPAITIVM